ncbi:hypothetical protein TL16_g04459 [Triparma laevis f. inornata]|uniref:Uncharacterized protein n=1 Tax=Triparma laevis f. inornata TaxID=1714386 RepID=A0A9W7E649_9STRA|nr:hypothetical protein TL16_g04459 [Triparma laevis f. inornata]
MVTVLLLPLRLPFLPPPSNLQPLEVTVNTGIHSTSTFPFGASSDPLTEWHLQTPPSSILSPYSSSPDPKVDPFVLTSEELKTMSQEMMDLLSSSHPVLSSCAGYFFTKESGKKETSHGGLLETQRRLAEITEMIHTASLFHDDVIDKSTTRRSLPSVNHQFGNKLAILAGDFLLARASVSLSRLRNLEVTEVMSTVIEHLVKGEVMQMRVLKKGNFEYYLKKNFYKTSSLMANSCMSAAILAGVEGRKIEGSYNYGKYLGNAFQLIDDVLDFNGSQDLLGKPLLSDLNSGVTTAPVLYAAEEYPEMYEIIERKYGAEGDIDKGENEAW